MSDFQRASARGAFPGTGILGYLAEEVNIGFRDIGGFPSVQKIIVFDAFERRAEGLIGRAAF